MNRDKKRIIPQVLLYNEVIQYDSINTLLIKNFTNTPYGFDIFTEDMKNNMIKNKDNILKIN